MRHPLAARAVVAMSDLSGHGAVAMPDDSALRDYRTREYDDASTHVPVRLAVDSWLNAVSLVRRGVGICLGPLFRGDYYPPDVAVVPLVDPPIIQAAVVTRKRVRQHPAAARYVDRYLAAVRG